MADHHQISDEALVARVVAECPFRRARASPEYRLPGWFPCRLTPVNLMLSALPDLITLEVHKLSGCKCAEVLVPRRHLPKTPETPENFCFWAWRTKIFGSMAQVDPDFPIHAPWFLMQIRFTPLVYQGAGVMCTALFPGVDIDHEEPGYDAEGGNHDPWDAGPKAVGMWSDPGTLLVGFYMARTAQQQASLAKCIAKLGAAYSDSYSSAVSRIFSSPKFMVVNCLKGFAYRDVEYDTTLYHLLLDRPKRWNYQGFWEIFDALLSREDLDVSCSGWSWAKQDTVSVAQLCFYEWCAITSRAPHSWLWVDDQIPRLYLLSACLHVPPQQGRSSQMAKQLQKLMEDEPVFHKRRALRTKLMRDLKLLGSGDALSLPGSLVAADVLRVADSLFKR